MDETAKDELCANAGARPDLRAIAAAWLVCALIAAIALVLSGDLRASAVSEPIATVLMQLPDNGQRQ